MKSDFKFLNLDLKAGITVFLVAVPLCLGIALASGVPILSGLIAGIIGGIVVGKLSGSHLSVSGPAAGLVAIVLAATQELGHYNMVLTALVLAGVIQIILGSLGAGVIAHFIPHSVVKGMLAAIGIILILKQIPHAFGYDGVFEGSLSFNQNDGHNTLSEFLTLFQHISNGAIIISLISFALLYLVSRDRVQKIKFFKFFPASLIVIIAGALLNKLFMLVSPELALSQEHLVRIPNLYAAGGISSALIYPDLAAFKFLATYKYAFIFAIVASIETLLCIEATDKLDPQKRVTSTSRELKAQGVGNFLSGLIGGLPITSVIVRSSVNIENNAQTKLSAIIHGILLIFTVLVGSPLINTVPLASLACILILVGYKLTSEKLVRDMLHKGVNQFFPFMITIVAILFTDLLTGVLIGLITALFLILRNYYKIQRFDLVAVKDKKDYYQLVFSEYLTFLSKASLEKSLHAIPANSSIEFDFTATNMVDHEVKDMFEDFKIASLKNNIGILAKGNHCNKLDICFEQNSFNFDSDTEKINQLHIPKQTNYHISDEVHE